MWSEIYDWVLQCRSLRKYKWMKHKQECIPARCIPSAAVAVCRGGGVCPGGVCAGISVRGCLSRDVCLRGVSAQWGGVSGRHSPCERNDWQTGVKTLRMVINNQYYLLKNNTAQLYFILVTAKLHWNFSSSLKDVLDIYWYPTVHMVWNPLPVVAIRDILWYTGKIWM